MKQKRTFRSGTFFFVSKWSIHVFRGITGQVLVAGIATEDNIAWLHFHSSHPL